MRSLSIRRRWGVLAILVLAMVPLAIAVPTGGAGPVAKAALAPQGPAQGCRLIDPQPASPLEMNTVVQNNLFKTVVMEKEIFSCQTAAGAAPAIRDLQTFIEVVQNGRQLVEIRAETATCDKLFQTGVIKCVQKPLPQGTAQTPLNTCDPASQYVPADPVVMNTELSKIVKTITVEKEVFVCGPVLREIYLFTEILEVQKADPNVPGGQTYRPALRRSFGVMCIKRVPVAAIVSCARFATS